MLHPSISPLTLVAQQPQIATNSSGLTKTPVVAPQISSLTLLRAIPKIGCVLIFRQRILSTRDQLLPEASKSRKWGGCGSKLESFATHHPTAEFIHARWALLRTVESLKTGNKSQIFVPFLFQNAGQSKLKYFSQPMILRGYRQGVMGTKKSIRKRGSTTPP